LVKRVAEAIVRRKTRVLDFDLRAYFDNVRHDRLLAKVAQRIDDADVMHLLKVMLKASGKKGVPQGGVISPLLSNLYLNEVDKMLERAREVTRNGKYTYIEYARFADDLVILIDAYKRHDWLIGAVDKRLREEFGKLQVEINDEKSRTVDLERGECFGFLGFEFRYLRGLSGAIRPHYTPKLKKRTALVRALKEVFRRHRSQPIVASGTKTETIARARQLIAAVAPVQTVHQPQPPDSAAATDQATHPCPCCGGRMNIIETFKRGSTPHHRPTGPIIAVRIDTS
jgi:RNA-directed DNA polymerase